MTPAVDPTAGMILGMPWGASPAACAEALGDPLSEIERRPEGAVMRAPQPIGVAGHALWVHLEFELDALVAVRGRSASLALACPEGARPVFEAAEAWFSRPLVRADEGWWEVAHGRTRLTVDLIDGTLTFEERAP